MPEFPNSIEPTGAVIPIRAHMSEREYDEERARLAATYGDDPNSNVQIQAKRDQAWAFLFVRSGWTQQELAAKEGKSISWISYRLRFGCFLNFSTAVEKAESLPANLTERRFRGFWEQTDKT